MWAAKALLSPYILLWASVARKCDMYSRESSEINNNMRTYAEQQDEPSLA